jgi:hypothetical protein
MANVFKNAFLAATASFSTIYTAPAATTSQVYKLSAANIDGVATVTVSVRVRDSSGAVSYYLIKDAEIPIKSSLEIVQKPICLETGDYIEALAGATSDVEIIASILEMS